MGSMKLATSYIAVKEINLPLTFYISNNEFTADIYLYIIDFNMEVF